MTRVSIVIVTFNSARWLPRALDHAAQQEEIETEIVVVDNASSDRSAGIAGEHASVAKVIRNASNLGFAAGQNTGIAATSGEVILCLNPDVFLARDFLARLIPRLTGAYGFATGKLVRADPTTGCPNGTLDSTGIFFKRNRRHVDRGAGESDDGRYGDPSEVFGATGAALLARRDALEAVSPPGSGPFDEAFFAYREDADLAWRAQLLGFRCFYDPSAVAAHVRALRPDHRRSHLDPTINMHSVKNRYLMLIKNETWEGLRPDLIPFLAREAVIAGGVLLRERSSLRAYPLLFRCVREARHQRRWITERRQVSAAELRSHLLLDA